MKTIENIHYAEPHDNDHALNIYLPDTGKQTDKVFVYFHGGGLEAGDKNCAGDEFADYLTDRGIAVVSANYRMYPSAKYPEFLVDSAAAVAWVCEHIKEYGDYTEVYVGGSSAGGYISMMLCFDKSYLARHGIDSDKLAGYVHDAGQPTCHFNILRERGIDTRRVIIDESAPFWHIGTRNTCAPMFFIVSDNDMTNRYEQTVMLLKTLEHFEYDASKIGHIVMHGGHCHYIAQKDENGDSVFGKLIYNFISEH
ncbi:MAG: alpha/beta hydrolase [Clostridia bacterium]|nr:alpha/beta hydrolase [Clostridia bacterium]